MQGNEAVSSLISAMESIRIEIDRLKLEAVVIIRGGGAQLDLDCFDDYRLAAAMANFPLPIFTGIGHERDETVADLVAHTRLKTPTAVAEFLLSGFREFEENLTMLLQRLDRSTRQQLRAEENRIHQYSLRAKSLSANRISLEKEKVKNQAMHISLTAKNQFRNQYATLENLEKSLKKNLTLFLIKQSEKLSNTENLLRQLEPSSILKRGYSRTEYAGKPIHLTSVKLGDQIETITQSQKNQQYNH
ncbi:exodeoxyribonuclease VII large subunit [Algoriphagus boritolerans]|uniref:exodeoxyribonuclease VII large subunit n=1 Tax=Algoriphagus boritolerans TaxID=308111 RepID=UPI002FCE3232